MAVNAPSNALSDLEHALRRASDDLLSADPLRVEAANRLLRGVVEGLIAFTQATTGKAISADEKMRLGEIQTTMGTLRQNLAHRSAFVDQALKIIVPNSVQPTYGDAKQRYAQGARRSGTVYGLKA